MKVLAAALAAAIVLSGASAHAATLDTAVGKYLDKNGQYSFPAPDTLIVATASDAAHKGAGFVVHITDLDRTKPGEDLILGFPNSDAWARFVQLWQKALAIKRTPNMPDQEIGEYFDVADEVILKVNVSDEGIEFQIVGKYQGKTAVTIFHMVKIQLPYFADNVKTVTSYFKK